MNDGAPIVSVGDCVRATECIFNGLLHDKQSLTDDFQKYLDILDDHDSFYEVAFQSKFFEMSRNRSFFDHGFQSHSAEGRETFGKNLRMLVERLESRVADPKIVLAGFLLGFSAIDALTIKDRAQGNPRWLEHAILDRAHDPRMLMRPDSSLSVVLNSLLSSADDAERKAFWDSRPERNLTRQSHDSQEFGR